MEFSVGDVHVVLSSERLAGIDDADLVEEITAPDAEATVFLLAGRGDAWPALGLRVAYAPAVAGFPFAVHVVPETGVLFVGAGRGVHAYRLDSPRLLWHDETACGFWGWSQYGDVVLMSAELELAAWSTSGEKLWATGVEPPWTYAVHDGTVSLDVLGEPSSFPVRTGPPVTGVT
ncbi:hypothetical protein [Allokutzneria albata]|uniref:PQQ-like domain-containing protein n=1 Tax=Allokutzneria albata TaxID=211114 RepID=A0A1G9ZP47_ALLAB|nr:hypothetical protein [Allokutzneria albata]SDN22376.1 hypothetical protein SAMN04489726_5592 [Allokutzneria albata]